MAESKSDLFGRVLLEDETNWSHWLFTLTGLLIDHDLDKYLYVDPTTLKSAEDKLNARKCYSKLARSLSETVVNSLPSECRDHLNPNAHLLWTELQKYSAFSPARQAQLLQTLFTTKVQPGENPTAALGTLQSAHQQLTSAGVSFTADKVLAFAMTFALPDEYAVVKQTLWQKKDLTSKMVADDARLEWGRKEVERSGEALAVYQPPNRRVGGLSIANPSGKCHVHPMGTHTNGECTRQGGTPPPGYQPRKFNKSSNNSGAKRTGSAAVAEGSGEEAQAYCSAHAVLGEKDRERMLVDCGANYHMVWDSTLLSNLSPPTTVRNVKVGSGHLLPVAATGCLQLGPLSLDNVLVVPGLTVNLLSTSKTPQPYWWKIDHKAASCMDKADQIILHAPCQNGLYALKN